MRYASQLRAEFVLHGEAYSACCARRVHNQSRLEVVLGVLCLRRVKRPHAWERYPRLVGSAQHLVVVATQVHHVVRLCLGQSPARGRYYRVGERRRGARFALRDRAGRVRNLAVVVGFRVPKLPLTGVHPPLHAPLPSGPGSLHHPFYKWPRLHHFLRAAAPDVPHFGIAALLLRHGGWRLLGAFILRVFQLHEGAKGSLHQTAVAKRVGQIAEHHQLQHGRHGAELPCVPPNQDRPRKRVPAVVYPLPHDLLQAVGAFHNLRRFRIPH
mmetsp:Transcript_10797/g.26471  ORF Transcript_10797/g.26471 Transcript_10797/m.26471 type:complete len:269 (-) Transcript_10797:856-1662(-)